MRNSKAPLALMEQVLMILVFAMAAAICVQAFVHCGLGSRDIEREDVALSAATTVADAVRANDAGILAHYGISFVQYEDIEDVPLMDGRDYEQMGLRVSVVYGEGTRYLWTADVHVTDGDGTDVVTVHVSGQKEA